MSVRNEFLTRRLDEYLDRRNPPQHLVGKPEIAAKEMSALERTLIRHAPIQGYDDWFERFEDQLGQINKTRVWPTEYEIHEAIRAVRPQNSRRAPETFDKTDPLDLAARRMQAGEPVAPACVFGRHSNMLLSRGMISQERMDIYRLGLAQQSVDAYGDGAEDHLRRAWGDHAASFVQRLRQERAIAA